jgi:hypothetical protein
MNLADWSDTLLLVIKYDFEFECKDKVKPQWYLFIYKNK